jgi:hypothetical protein
MSSTNKDPALAVTFFLLFSVGKSIDGATDSHLFAKGDCCLRIVLPSDLLLTTRKGTATGFG